MGLRNYEGPAEIRLDGTTVAEITQFRLRVLGNNQRVRTMIRGLAGKSDGPRESEGQFDTAIPIEGYEADYYGAVLNGAFVDITFVDGGKSRIVSGWMEELEASRSTDQAASTTVQFVGRAPRSL